MVTMILELAGIVHVIAWLTFFMGLSNGDQRHTKFIIFKYSLSIKFLQDAETVTELLSLPESNSQRPKFYNFRCLHSEMQEWTMQMDRQLRSSPKRSNLWKTKWPVFALMLTLKIGAEWKRNEWCSLITASSKWSAHSDLGGIFCGFELELQL